MTIVHTCLSLGLAKRVRNPPTYHKREGPLWASVKITMKEHDTSPHLECINCGFKFCGGATHIAKHIIHHREVHLWDGAGEARVRRGAGRVGSIWNRNMSAFWPSGI